jgi:hypothetical protein
VTARNAAPPPALTASDGVNLEGEIWNASSKLAKQDQDQNDNKYET